MSIQANVTNQQITASVGETKIDVSVSGGVGPTGAQGPAGSAGLPSGTEGYVLTYVSGSWVAAAPSGGVTSWNDLEDKPSTFAPSAHAASHGYGGDDPISIDSTQVVTMHNGPTIYWANFGEMQNAIDAALAARPTSDSLATVAVSGSYDDLSDLPTLFSGSYTDLTNKPTLFDGSYTSLTNVPSTFTPASHNQAWSTITSTPTTLSGYGITDAVASNDARLTDARTPTAHKTSHATGGTDALSPSDIGAAAASHVHAWGDITSGVPSSFTPIAHKSTHATGGSDALTAADIGAASATHTHAASDINSGTLSIDRIPTGTTSTTVAIGNHTHAQLHDRSHAITSTSDHTAGNWKVLYSNGSGQVVELALGASGTVLQSGGASAAPSFGTVQKTITSGTADPTGGVDGDIYLKYTA